MSKQDQNNKIFADLSLAMVIIGLLGPFIIRLFLSQELTLGFSIVAILLSFIFGIVGRKHKTGKVSIVIVGIILVCSGTVSLWLMHMEKEAHKQVLAIEKEYNQKQ